MGPVAQHQEYAEKVIASPSALHEVRRDVANYLSEEGLGQVADDVLLILTELLTNVYKHVNPHEAEIRLVPQGPTFLVSVSDSSWALPRVTEPKWDSVDGRGMFLISQICPNWETTITGTGKRICCILPVPGAPAELGRDL